jgi:hypothetical protein
LKIVSINISLIEGARHFFRPNIPSQSRLFPSDLESEELFVILQGSETAGALDGFGGNTKTGSHRIPEI